MRNPMKISFSTLTRGKQTLTNVAETKINNETNKGSSNEAETWVRNHLGRGDSNHNVNLIKGLI